METETTMPDTDLEPTTAPVAAPGPRTSLVLRAPADVALMPVMNIEMALERLHVFQDFVKSYLQESQDGGTDGGDYGIIPGTKKSTLFKSGADKLCDVYGLADRYRIVMREEDFTNNLFDYTIECSLYRKTDEMFVGSGLGSCSSYESRYRYRKAERTCPECGAAAIIKGKTEFGGGWVCWRKKGGCDAKFRDGDAAIEAQSVGRVENEDLADVKNSVLKVALKRAKVAAVIGVTRSSGIFTQDLDDLLPPKTLEIDATIIPPAGPRPDAAASASATSAPANETHAQKIARTKAEHAKQQQAAQDTKPAAPDTKPAAPQSAVNQAVSTATGMTQIAHVNVRNGPKAMKNGEEKPAWILYVISFTTKVKGPDGVMLSDATTFDEKIAMIAEDAADARSKNAAQGFVRPTIEKGEKKGTYNITELETA